MSSLRPSRRVFAASMFAGVALAACGGGNNTQGQGQGQGGSPGSAAPGGSGGANLSGDLPGSGATFPKPYYEVCMTTFKAVNQKVNVTYGGGGSGKGRTDLQNELVLWAGSDGLVKDEDKPKFKGGEFQYVPTVAAPITLSYNLPEAKDLKLDADTIAKIFTRKIKTWDDPAIKALNSGGTLPSKPITVARRSDSSGTTENFSKYLEKAAKASFGLKGGSTVEWPADTQGGDGNSGVADIITKTEGAIGYVDLADAITKKLTFAEVKNANGEFVKPTVEAASKALEGAEVKDDLTYDPLNAKGAGAYPITAPTWVLVYKKQKDKEKAELVKAWLKYLVKDGQNNATKVNYAKLPESLQKKALDAIEKISA